MHYRPHNRPRKATFNNSLYLTTGPGSHLCGWFQSSVHVKAWKRSDISSMSIDLNPPNMRVLIYCRSYKARVWMQLLSRCEFIWECLAENDPAISSIQYLFLDTVHEGHEIYYYWPDRQVSARAADSQPHALLTQTYFPTYLSWYRLVLCAHGLRYLSARFLLPPQYSWRWIEFWFWCFENYVEKIQ